MVKVLFAAAVGVCIVVYLLAVRDCGALETYLIIMLLDDRIRTLHQNRMKEQLRPVLAGIRGSEFMRCRGVCNGIRSLAVQMVRDGSVPIAVSLVNRELGGWTQDYGGGDRGAGAAGCRDG